MYLIFCMKINIKVFYKLILSFLVAITWYVQSNKFAISLQYLKKGVKDEVDFLHADKHQFLPQLDTIVFGGSTKNTSLQYLSNISRKRLCINLQYQV